VIGASALFIDQTRMATKTKLHAAYARLCLSEIMEHRWIIIFIFFVLLVVEFDETLVLTFVIFTLPFTRRL
jgi:hypothetical protein